MNDLLNWFTAVARDKCAMVYPYCGECPFRDTDCSFEDIAEQIHKSIEPDMTGPRDD